MLSKSLKNLHLLNKNKVSKKNSILKKIYNKDSYLIKLNELNENFYKSLFNKDFNGFDIYHHNSKYILDKLVYLYKKYNFFVFNDIKSILFVLSASGKVEEFQFFYELFKQNNQQDDDFFIDDFLIYLYIVSIIYDNFNVFNFLNIKEKTLIESVNEKIRKPFFVLAAKYGSVKIVNYFINKGININIKDKDEIKTALIYASENGHIEVVKLLIENNAKLDESGKGGINALIGATKNNHLEIVKLLLWKILEGRKNITNEKEIEDYNNRYLNKKDDMQKTALIWAAISGYTQIIKLLIESGANLNEKDAEKKTALMNAAYYGKVESTKTIIDEIVKNRKKIKDKDKIIKYNNEYLNIKDDYEGKTALMWAIHYGDLKRLDILKIIIETGANINEKDKNGNTALMLAVTNNNLTNIIRLLFIKLLIDNGANLDEKNDEGKTAIILASQMGNIEVVELLVKNGANIDEQEEITSHNIARRNALMRAIENNYIKVVELLINNGANLSVSDALGDTPLMLAIHDNNVEIVKLLLEKIIKNREKIKDKNQIEQYNNKYLNTRNHFGKTALMLAALQNNIEIMDLLIKSGADINAEGGDYNKTALIYAAEEGKVAAVEFLIRNGAFLYHKDDNYKTALDYAAENGHTEIVKLLIKNRAIVTKSDGEKALKYVKNDEIKQLILEALEKVKNK